MHLFPFSKAKSNEYLQLICDAANEVDDVQGKAVYDCCHFDGLLELGKFNLVVEELIT